MQKIECYYVLLDLHGPESKYRPIFEVLHSLGAKRLDGGFPVWMFCGEPDAHDLYRAKFEPLLPPLSIYEPDVSYGFLLMSSRGFVSFGNYRLGAGAGEG